MFFQTEFEFTFPKGYVDNKGKVHKEGVMRLATAADEILPLKDPRVQENPAYLTIVLLSRVIVSIGTIDTVNTSVIEKLFAEDFAYIQEFYGRINIFGNSNIKANCPNCGRSFEINKEEFLV